MVEVWKSREKVHYKNLQTCGSVWILSSMRGQNLGAPARGIGPRDRDMEKGRWSGSHGHAYSAALSTSAIKGSARGIWESAPSHAASKTVEEVGAVRTHRDGKGSRSDLYQFEFKIVRPEVSKGGKYRTFVLRYLSTNGTKPSSILNANWYYGENGWHVHSHEILFIKPGLIVRDELRLHREIFFMWLGACRTAGLGEPDFQHGVQVQDGHHAGKYASKWGMDCELTKGHIKQARGEGNYSPWDMLREYGKGRKEFESLFREYARAFRGKRQLVWSDGMRNVAGLGAEASDEELAARVETDAVFLGALDRARWRLVTAAEKRGELLEIAALAGWEGVKKFIRGLVKEA